MNGELFCALCPRWGVILCVTFREDTAEMEVGSRICQAQRTQLRQRVGSAESGVIEP